MFGYRRTHNTNCESALHEQHLCYLYCHKPKIYDVQQFDEKLKGAEYVCSECLRTAKDKNLCEPVKL